jgi:hypothetical protein
MGNGLPRPWKFAQGSQIVRNFKTASSVEGLHCCSNKGSDLSHIQHALETASLATRCLLNFFFCRLYVQGTYVSKSNSFKEHLNIFLESY